MGCHTYLESIDVKRAILLFGVGGLLVILFVVRWSADDPIVGLITKTHANPFFVKMQEAAVEKADELDVDLRTFAGEFDGDWQTQLEAIESLVAAGAEGILITPSDPAALSEAVRTAREAGVLVIALDTPFDPADSVDGTFATDNFGAGELVGRWARARLGESWPSAAVATLDGSESPITVDVLRNQGFLKGFGIDIEDPAKRYDENDQRMVGSAFTRGTEDGGQTAMESLLSSTPRIDVVYAVNEPAAAGAYTALEQAGRAGDVLIVSIDGGCAGVRDVAAGAIAATAMQFPLRMASLGVEAVVYYLEVGARPSTTPGLDFYDTGVALVTDHPVSAIPSITSAEALKECWG